MVFTSAWGKLPWESAIIVTSKTDECFAELAQIIDALNSVGLGLGFSQHRKKHACQNSYDGNDHQ